MLTQSGCASRQKRLQELMQTERWDLFLTSDYRTVYYFTGLLVAPEFPSVFVQRSDGRTSLISATSGVARCDTQQYLETYSIKRSIDTPGHEAAQLLKQSLADNLSGAVRSCGVECESTAGIYEHTIASQYSGVALLDASESLRKMRKPKDADEVDSIRENLDLCAVAYDAAREIIAPGVTEIDVYSEMHKAINKASGKTITFAGDFACGLRGIKEGGTPTLRKIQNGDLYILDIFPAIDLYRADTTRTFCVGQPTDIQMQVWHLILDAIRMGEVMAQPGIPASAVYESIKLFLDAHTATEKSFWHHLGHGLGHRGHEAPRIIPGSSDVFEVGDVFTIEPGVYTHALQGGVRLEDNYLMTSSGPQDLFSYSWAL